MTHENVLKQQSFIDIFYHKTLLYRKFSSSLKILIDILAAKYIYDISRLDNF